MKVLKIIKSYNDVLELQNCLTKISQWANMWQMEISFDKCMYMYTRFGTSVFEFQYSFGDCVIKKVPRCDRSRYLYLT